MTKTIETPITKEQAASLHDVMRKFIDEITVKEEVKEWPQAGDKYWCITACGSFKEVKWFNDDIDKYSAQQGNIFRTSGEAEYHRKMQDLAAGIRAQGRGFVEGEHNHHAYYSHTSNLIAITHYYKHNQLSRANFPTVEAVEAAFEGVSGEDFLYMLNGGMV